MKKMLISGILAGATLCSYASGDVYCSQTIDCTNASTWDQCIATPAMPSNPAPFVMVPNGWPVQHEIYYFYQAAHPQGTSVHTLCYYSTQKMPLAYPAIGYEAAYNYPADLKAAGNKWDEMGWNCLSQTSNAHDCPFIVSSK